jgi:hypothetical protein
MTLRLAKKEDIEEICQVGIFFAELTRAGGKLGLQRRQGEEGLDWRRTLDKGGQDNSGDTRKNVLLFSNYTHCG